MKFRSGFEETVERTLKRRKVEYTYETEKLPYVLEKNYIPDFIITKKDGSKMYLEAKGYFKSADRTKLLLVKKHNPDIDLRMIFQQDNWMTKKKKSRYSDWAKKNDIPYAVGGVPAKWLQE